MSKKIFRENFFLGSFWRAWRGEENVWIVLLGWGVLSWGIAIFCSHVLIELILLHQQFINLFFQKIVSFIIFGLPLLPFVIVLKFIWSFSKKIKSPALRIVLFMLVLGVVSILVEVTLFVTVMPLSGHG